MRKFFLVLCVLLLCGCSGVNNEPNDEDPVDEDPVDEEPARVVLEVPNAITIIDVFYNNELDGNKQYFGKWVKTSALFDKIDHSWTGDLWVYFDAKNSKGYYGHYGILCNEMSKEEKAKISNFDKGKPVVFIGLNQGIIGDSRIEFNKCEFPEY